jgi:hypothetical protein
VFESIPNEEEMDREKCVLELMRYCNKWLQAQFGAASQLCQIIATKELQRFSVKRASTSVNKSKKSWKSNLVPQDPPE